MYEVELKFPVDSFDRLRDRLSEHKAVALEVENHCDTYYAHPARDFAETREALRVRRINGQPLVTYKGPKLPGAVKTRIELEWPLNPGDADGTKMESLLEHLGFRRVASVVKRRESFRVSWQDRDLTITLDDVESVGRFSEIESVAQEDQIEQARCSVSEFAEVLGLRQPEPRSYLRMLLESE